MTRWLSGCAAIAARPPILMAMAASGLFALGMPRRRVRRPGPPNPRPAPKPHASRVRSRDWERSSARIHDDWERSSNRAAGEAKSGFLASCRRATPEDYSRWLADRDPAIRTAARRDYELDTRNTHTDRCWGYPQWVVAERDIRVTPLHGAMAVNIIVPPGVKVEGDLGHSEAFLMGDGRMDGRRLNGYGDATRYRNT